MTYKHTVIAGIVYYILVALAAAYHVSSMWIMAIAPVFYFILACLLAFASYIAVTIAGFVAIAGYYLFGLEKPARVIDDNMVREAIIYIVFMVSLIGLPIYVFL